MKKSSQVIGLPLISINEGLECGIIQDIAIDPQKKKIQSLIIRGPKSEYDFRELKLGDVTGIGKDYVITQSVDNAKHIESLGPGASLLKVKCIAASGDVLGSINTFMFEEKTGVIDALQIDSGLEIDGHNILSFSNNLLFVNPEDNGADNGAEDIEKTDTKETDAGDKTVFSSLEKERKEYLLGRTVKNDIKNEDGTVIIKKGTLVTADIIYLADRAGVTIDLTLEVE